MSNLQRVGALARWHAEMRQGIRGNRENCFSWTADDLWSAACKEKAAIQAEADGDLTRARYFMDWALLQLNGFPLYVSETDKSGTRHMVPGPVSRDGKALLAKLRGTLPAASASPDPVQMPPQGRRRTLTAGLGL